jgi:hypothetical protein
LYIFRIHITAWKSWAGNLKLLKEWTKFWQDYISIFWSTKDHYYWHRGKKKRAFFALAIKLSKKWLKCRILGPSYEKNIIWD